MSTVAEPIIGNLSFVFKHIQQTEESVHVICPPKHFDECLRLAIGGAPQGTDFVGPVLKLPSGAKMLIVSPLEAPPTKPFNVFFLGIIGENTRAEQGGCDRWRSRAKQVIDLGGSKQQT